MAVGARVSAKQCMAARDACQASVIFQTSRKDKRRISRRRADRCRAARRTDLKAAHLQEGAGVGGGVSHLLADLLGVDVNLGGEVALGGAQRRGAASGCQAGGGARGNTGPARVRNRCKEKDAIWSAHAGRLDGRGMQERRPSQVSLMALPAVGAQGCVSSLLWRQNTTLM